MSFLATAARIVNIAEKAFPEFFSSVTPTEKEWLTESAERCLGFGLHYPFADDPTQSALQDAVMREFSIVRLMILDRVIAEERHNVERVLMFIGESVAVVAAVVPTAVAIAGKAAAQIPGEITQSMN